MCYMGKRKIDLQFQAEHAYLGLDLEKIDWDILHKPFDMYKSEEQYELVLRAIRDLDNFYFTCKYILNIEPAVFQGVWMKVLFQHPFPMLIASRGISKSWFLAVYLLTKSLILQGHKSVIVGASFRQSKVIFEYMETMWNNAPVLRDICGEGSGPKRLQDVWSFKIGKSVVNALPVGDGSKIRGQRANTIVADEFQSQNELIYEIVVAGFASVSSSPIENIKKEARNAFLLEKGLIDEGHTIEARGGIYRGNQSILAGTADWGFKHFAKYWKKYKGFVESQGNIEKIREVAGGGDIDKDFNWKDYAVIRLPVELGPPGLMDKKHIKKQEATVSSAIFNMEYGCCFAEDSDNFFKMSIVQSCVTNDPIELPSGKVQFTAALAGNKYKKYIMGIDPASESDNFSIIILELHEDHRRIVYCWTTDRHRHQAAKKGGKTDENAFYSYAARKIRDLLTIFPCEYISLDSQGGGIAVMEALHDKNLLLPGELPIWTIHKYVGKDDNPILWENSKDWGHDDHAGLHMIEMVSMSNATYVADANHMMKKDFESRILLFPCFDPISLNEAWLEDQKLGRSADTLEDCFLEIEELKKELATISYSSTLTGRDKWDTPEILDTNGRKIRMRKDRYSALLMANSLARRVMNTVPIVHQHIPAGGFASEYKSKETSGSLYTGPDWWTGNVSNHWGSTV